jgi:hypothetical protein
MREVKSTTGENEGKNDEKSGMNGADMPGSYLKFVLMMTISFVIMYAVMFLNVDEFDHVYLSLTRFYMTLLMVAPMALVMMGFMRSMYKNKRLNISIIAASIVVFVLALIFLRTQTFVGDRQYMKAMIPHHSSAIMTSKHAAISDPEAEKLSEGIIESQEREIRLMKELLDKTR